MAAVVETVSSSTLILVSVQEPVFYLIPSFNIDYGVKASHLLLTNLCFFPIALSPPFPFQLKEEEFTVAGTMNSETQNPKLPSGVSSGAASDAAWDDSIDETDFVEATEDAELAEAAENVLLSYSGGVDEIPDELIMQVLQE